MKINIVPVLGFAFVILFLAGCYRAAGTGRPEAAECRPEAAAETGSSCPKAAKTGGSRPGSCRIQTEPSEEKALSAEGSSAAEPRVPAAENNRTYVLNTEEPEKAAVQEEENPKQTQTEPSDQPKSVRRAARENDSDAVWDPKTDTGTKEVFGAIQRIYHTQDVPPKDTVNYIPSRREEITDTRYVPSVVDENNPDTYDVVEKVERVPSRYLNQAGDVKYAYEDGVWYEYKYSSGNVCFSRRSDQLALALLKPRGKYDRLEVVDMDCREVMDEAGEIQYQYYVRYCGICAMDQAPTETANLTREDLGIVAATMSVRTVEKVPVLMQVTVGTGEYRYYGWQELDGKIYYFDENGEKVTGPQVIQGIRHEFDEEGVKISQAGVEVSAENGPIDWEQVRASQIDLAMIRCAYRDPVTGDLVPDEWMKQNLTGANQAGLKTGIFLFSQAVTVEEAEEEAEFLIETARRYGVRGPAALMVSYANPEQSGRADRIGREARTTYIAAACQVLREAGYEPMLHTEETFLQEELDAEGLPDCQFWLTGYDAELTYTGSCAIRQYTDRGTVNGISGYTGLNISYGK